jgi:hypothetical protein
METKLPNRIDTFSIDLTPKQCIDLTTLLKFWYQKAKTSDEAPPAGFEFTLVKMGLALEKFAHEVGVYECKPGTSECGYDENVAAFQEAYATEIAEEKKLSTGDQS